MMDTAVISANETLKYIKEYNQITDFFLDSTVECKNDVDAQNLVVSIMQLSSFKDESLCTNYPMKTLFFEVVLGVLFENKEEGKVLNVVVIKNINHYVMLC